ncbi:hypothetical protein AAE478_009085 [Parahypoxylon ruwenzoriense]
MGFAPLHNNRHINRPCAVRDPQSRWYTSSRCLDYRMVCLERLFPSVHLSYQRHRYILVVKSDCGPPGYTNYFETYYYSPALCPNGFTVSCSRYGEFQGPPVQPTETAMLCVMRRIGIGVGVGLAGLLAIGLGIFIWRYRKNHLNGGGAGQSSQNQKPPPGQYLIRQYSYKPGPGRPGQPSPQGYTTYPGCMTYADPKINAVSYYSPVPQPMELGGAAIEGPAIVHSQGTPSVAGSQPTYPRESAFSNGQPVPLAADSSGDPANPSSTGRGTAIKELSVEAPPLAVPQEVRRICKRNRK